MQQLSMFDMMSEPTTKTMPLAGRVRPKTLAEFVGQEHLLGPGCMLRTLIEHDRISSMIFWGPPGVGKTTLASIIAGQTRSEFINFSAVTSGIKEIKEVMKQAEDAAMRGIRTVLFVDEIHRFNKAQQDAFLPYVEKGSIILIGATTENPSFEVNGALLSRCKVFVLKPLTEDNIFALLRHALTCPEGFGNNNVKMSDDQVRAIAAFAGGDARTALNTLEMAVMNGTISADGIEVTDEQVEQCISRRSLLYDKSGEEHYNLISALHKSMRNSDPDAAVYWALRMLDSGEDPLYIARRMVRFASEDVGIADSNALAVAINVYQACHYLGVPECNVHIAHAAAYLSMAPKSNALEVACNEVAADLQNSGVEPVPLWIRNAPTGLMAELNYGKGYRYAHNYEGALTPMPCLPDALAGREYYRPKQSGAEAAIAKRLEEIKEWKAAHRDEWSSDEG